MNEVRPSGQRATGVDSVIDAVGLRGAPKLTTSPVCKSGMSFVELNCESENVGLTTPVCEDALLIALQLRPCPNFDLYAGGKLIRPKQFDAGGVVAIYDVRMNLCTDLRDPFHAINLYLPHKALKLIADDAGVPSIDELTHRPGHAFEDPIARNLLLSMRPALAVAQTEACPLFVDHVAMALATYVAHRYGSMRAPRRVYRGGLAAWQERRAKELLSAHLSGALAVSDLATACDLSVRHFTRAFHQSTGVSPHRWLLERRIERAQSLLRGSKLTLIDIAFDCGFASQSHFGREFLKTVGLSPGAWRRVVRR
jgi:AraC-like DNA-binding protein